MFIILSKLCILNVRNQEAITDSIVVMIDYWILANCDNDATCDVKIIHVLENKIDEECTCVNDACVNLLQLLIKIRRCPFINTTCKMKQISLHKKSCLFCTFQYRLFIFCCRHVYYLYLLFSKC